MYAIGIHASTSAVTCSHGKRGHQFGCRSKPREGYVIAAIGMSPPSLRRILLSVSRRVVLSEALLRRSDSMSSATPSNDAPLGVLNESIARARRASTAGLTNPGRYQATTLDPARLERVDEEPERLRVDDVDRAAVVRGLDVDGLHPARGDLRRRRAGAPVGGRVVDVDPGAEPGEHAGVGARRRLRRDRHEREHSGDSDKHEAAHEGGVYAAGVRER